VPLLGEQLACRGEGGRLPGTGRPFDHDQRPVTGQRGDRPRLARIQPPTRTVSCARARGGVNVVAGFGAGLRATDREPSDEVALHIQHRLGGEDADVFRHPVPAQQRHTPVQRSGGEVFSQLTPHRRLDHDALTGQELFHLAADVGAVPSRAARREP